MRELIDLLEEARADAPPPRYGVDDVVAAGRRRRRRRNTGWAIAAVTAVAVAIGVPQIVTRSSGAVQRPTPAATSAAPKVTTTASKLYQFPALFQAQTVDGYQVGDPTVFFLNGASASVTDLADKKSTAVLLVLRPGIDGLTLETGSKAKPAVPVNGRPAWTLSTDDPNKVNFVWEYADGAEALISAASDGFDGGHNFGPAAMRKVAEGFKAGTTSETVVPIKAGYIPAGYRMIELVGDAHPSADSAPGALYFMTDKVANAWLAQPNRTRPNKPGMAIVGMWIRLEPPDNSGDPRPTSVTCTTGEASCFVWVDHGRYKLAVGGAYASAAQLRKVLASVQLADLAQPDTWYPANSAVPASAQLPNE